ncbi:hypothetical protein KZJ38_10085 [Paraburkholderia edwinii]|uniref:Uncharacterized protein n=1 Tax=Paraburkholderia edwinii TaxID=2861782 RepID=A0ABX8UUP2_9BURK|nr:hypothetical protein [Paraburkholderia edwinii]QYD70598.1 hypothetical protein KZJ38_10085 [Paraburkholderia edwinii]
MLDPRDKAPERAAHAALFYRLDETGPRPLRNRTVLDCHASAGIAFNHAKRKKRTRRNRHHADAYRIRAGGKPCGPKRRTLNRCVLQIITPLQTAIPGRPPNRKTRPAKDNAAGNAARNSARTAAKPPSATRRCQHPVVCAPCRLLHVHDVQRPARLQCRMLKTGRVCAPHAGTHPLANSVFNTEVAPLPNRLLFN